MFEFRCTDEGLLYYDPILRKQSFASNTLLFLIGYARAFGDTQVSDKLFIPHYIVDSESNLIALPNQSFFLNVRQYLNTLDSVESLDTGDMFNLYGLTLVLEQIGFYNSYKSTTPYNAKLNRVPHVPLFTKRSQDYKRIRDILTIKDYWNTEDKWKTNEAKEKYYQKPTAGCTGPDEYPLYTIFNTTYKGNQGDALDLYKSFGSDNFLKEWLYPTEGKPVSEYNDYCSWFIWDSLAFTQLYQFSLGVLYGMSNSGWATLPFTMRPSEYCNYYKYIQMVDEAFFWFQNTPFDKVGTNELFNLNAYLFRTDTYPVIRENRVLSSSIDQNYLYDPATNKYSLDNGETWITLEEIQEWAFLNNQALPVNGYSSSIPLYRGNELLELPLSDEQWIP